MTTRTTLTFVLMTGALGGLALADGELTLPPASPDADPVTQQVLTAPVSLEEVLYGGLPTAPFAGGGARAAGCADFSTQEIQCGVPPEGDWPSDVVFTPDGSQMVISHVLSQNVVVIDAVTQTVVQTIAVSGSPIGVAISSDGIHGVTANLFENTASIFSLATGAELAVVPVGTQPGGVRITPNGQTAVVSNTLDLSMSVIDIATATETHRIPGAGFAVTISLQPENGCARASFSQFEIATDTIAVLPDFGNDEIDFFDLSTGTVSSVACVADPIGVSITPNGQTAVVSHYYPQSSCTLVDVSTQSIVKNIPVGANTFAPITIKPDASKAVCSIQNACVVVDLATNAVSGSLSTASVNELVTTADGNYALAVGYYGSLISFSSQTIVKNLNNLFSADLGAVSPTAQRGVMVGNNYAEQALIVNTNGAAGFIEGQIDSGPPPEGDKTRRVAVSADGTIAVTTNIQSDNATVVDLVTNTVLGIVPVGDRPSGVAITPDGSKAVVANLDSTFATVIDIGTLTKTDVPISTRASEVAISPNGQYAYLAVVASGDGVWRIDLNTLTTSGGKVLTGNMGNVYTYMYAPTSGMTLSHDGGTLAVCGSFDNAVTLVDTASWSVVASVTVPAFPFRAIFTADDSTIYVTCKDGDQIARISNAGAASAVTGTVATGADPYQMRLSADELTLYLGDYGAQRLAIYDTTSFTLSSTVALPVKPQDLLVRGACVTICGGNWSVGSGPSGISFGAEGHATTVDTTTLAISQDVVTNLPPSELVPLPGKGSALIPSTFIDGLLRLDYDEVYTAYCFCDVGNPTGNVAPCGNHNDGSDPLGAGCAHDDSAAGARLDASGTASVTGDLLLLLGTRGPISNSTLFFQANNNLDGGGVYLGDGLRCAGGGLIRLKVKLTDAGGAADSSPAVISTRSASFGHPIAAGETLYYQWWFRDAAGSPCSSESNTSNGVMITWGP